MGLCWRLAVVVDLGLALHLAVHDVVLHDVINLGWDHALHDGITVQLDVGVVDVVVLDHKVDLLHVLLDNHLHVHRSVHVSGDKESILGSSVDLEVQLVSASLEAHQLHVQLLGGHVEGADQLVLHAVDGDHTGDALARNPVHLDLPVVVVVVLEDSVELGLPVRLNGEVKEWVGSVVRVGDGHLGLPHTSLHLPLNHQGALLGTVGQEGVLLDKLVVNLHVEESIKVVASVEVDVELDIVEVQAVEELLSGEGDDGVASLHQVAGVVVLDLEADSDDAKVEFLVPFSSAPLQPDSSCLWVDQQLLEGVDQVEGRGDGGSVGGGGQSQEDGNHFHLEVLT